MQSEETRMAMIPGTKTINTRTSTMKKLKHLAVLAFLFLCSGCAAQYDCYTCGRVSCHYCPPNPLPYSDSETCNCTDSIGQKYLSNMHSGFVVDIAPQNAENATNFDYYVDPPEQ